MAFCRIALVWVVLGAVANLSHAAPADETAALAPPSAEGTAVKEDDLKAESSYGLGYGLPYSYVTFNSYPYHYRSLDYHRYYSNPWYGYGLGYYDYYPYNYNSWLH